MVWIVLVGLLAVGIIVGLCLIKSKKEVPNSQQFQSGGLLGGKKEK